MPQAVARIGDPLSHGGKVTSGSSKLVDRTSGQPIARVGDTAQCAVHGTVTITSGCPTWEEGGRRIARVGSTCSCGAVITQGSPTVFAKS